MTGSNRTNLTTVEVFSKDVGAENLITCHLAEISGFKDFEIKLLAYLIGRGFEGVYPVQVLVLVHPIFLCFFQIFSQKKKEKSEQRLRGLFLQLCGGNLSQNPLISFLATADDDAAGDDRLWETL